MSLLSFQHSKSLSWWTKPGGSWFGLTVGYTTMACSTRGALGTRCVYIGRQFIAIDASMALCGLYLSPVKDLCIVNAFAV